MTPQHILWGSHSLATEVKLEQYKKEKYKPVSLKHECKNPEQNPAIKSSKGYRIQYLQTGFIPGIQDLALENRLI